MFCSDYSKLLMYKTEESGSLYGSGSVKCILSCLLRVALL